MTIQFPGDTAHFIATSRHILQEHGIEVTTGCDFAEYREIILKERPNQGLGIPFDPEKFNLNAQNAFWLLGRNDNGELIHTQACKNVALDGRNLASYLVRHFREFPPAIPDLDLRRSRYRATPGAHHISGEVIYHGEVWMAPEKGTYRGVGLSTVLARYGLLTAYQKWDPDWLFGFMARPVAFKGFAERMGYFHNEPGALRWYREGHEQGLEGFLSYLSRDDLSYLLDVPLAELVAQAA